MHHDIIIANFQEINSQLHHSVDKVIRNDVPQYELHSVSINFTNNNDITILLRENGLNFFYPLIIIQRESAIKDDVLLSLRNEIFSNRAHHPVHHWRGPLGSHRIDRRLLVLDRTKKLLEIHQGCKY